MEISQMRYFCEVCSTNSMSKAAENLHMSQQGLSIAIRRLESELNCDLFYRKPSGLVLTEYGKMFKAEAEEIIKRVNRIYEFCSDGNSATRITVVCTLNLLSRLPIELQNLLLNGTEEFGINFYDNWTCDCEDMILKDEAAFGIIYGDCDSRYFDSKTLDVVKQVFIVSREHALAQRSTVTLSQLDGVPLIVPYERCRPGQLIRKMFRDAGLELNIAYDCDRPQQTISVVANNPKLAARIIADDVTELDTGRVKVLTLEEDPFLLPICLVTKKGRTLSMRERFFQRLVVNCFRQ